MTLTVDISRTAVNRVVLGVMIINQSMKKILAIVACFVTLVSTIDQSCPCPVNAQCLGNGMCACQTGYIGNCSTPATPLSTTVTQANLVQGGTSLFQINPIDLNQFLQFTFQMCNTIPLTLTFTLYGQTGDTTSYNENNQLGSASTGTFQPGCQNLTTPYISFGQQPNGLNDLLILGIQDVSESASITLTVNQSVIIGVFFYYYVLIAITGIVAVVIIVGIGVFIYRQRTRRNGGTTMQGDGQQYNNIEHFQNMMPLFAAQRLGNDLSICPICLQQIDGAEVVRQTPCNHIFHSTCIDSWGLKNLSCPVCRYDLSLYAMGAAIDNSIRGTVENSNSNRSTIENRIRNSTIRMDVPFEDEWEEQPEVPIPEETIEAEQDQTPRNPGLLDDKYEIRQHML